MSAFISQPIDVDGHEEADAAKADMRARGFDEFNCIANEAGTPLQVWGFWRYSPEVRVGDDAEQVDKVPEYWQILKEARPA